MPSDSAQEKFEVLLERHRGIVSKVAGMYCGNAEDRRDLAQEISTQLWRSFARYDEQRPFATWMYRVALNVAISFARSANVRAWHVTSLEAIAHDSPDPGDPIEGREKLAHDGERVLALQRFIAGLDAMSRALLLLYMEEQSYREIALVLGISETNVGTKIHRLKQRIRRDMH